MRRRRYLAVAAAAVTGGLAGCGEAVTGVYNETSGRAEEEAERQVNESLDELVRPPNADVEVEPDGTIVVLSLDTDTVGVLCGLPETDDPVQEVQDSERGRTSPGALEGCEAERIVAVNEAGDIAVVERVE